MKKIGFILILIFVALSTSNTFAEIKKSREKDMGGYQIEAGEVFYRFAYPMNVVINFPIKLENSDLASFKILSDSHSKDKNQVYFRHRSIPGADPITFKIRGQFYGVDHTNVYYYWRVVIGADVGSFKALAFEYGQDKNHHYFNELVIADVDNKSFVPLSDYHSKDKNQVYYKTKVIFKADPKTFQSLNAAYGKDQNFVYLETSQIPEADPETFSFLGGRHSKDQKQVYYEKSALLLNLRNTILLNSDYIKDDNQVYRQGRVISGADSRTFVLLDKIGWYSKNKNKVYYLGRPVLGDPATFESIKGSYGKDKDTIYYQGKVVVGADQKTFRTVSNPQLDALDKDYMYKEGKKIEQSD